MQVQSSHMWLWERPELEVPSVWLRERLGDMGRSWPQWGCCPGLRVREVGLRTGAGAADAM